MKNIRFPSFKFFLSPVFKNGFLLLSFCVWGGGLSILMGQDASIDLLNYHLYNPFAFLHGRGAVDLIPAGMHTFFNPLLDIPYYLLFTGLNDFPRLTAFLQGLWYGVFLFAGWKVCALLWPGFHSPVQKLGRLSAFILACTGTATLSQIGLSSNEIPLAAGALFVCWLLLAQSRSAQTKPMVWAAAAALTGALFGLKYTFGPTAVGLALAGGYLWWRQGHTLKILGICLVCGIGGFLLTNGFFMWHLWQELGNPFFPYFNHIFQSPFFDAINLSNGTGAARTWLEAFTLPFTRLNLSVVEFQTDGRLALGLVSWSIWLILLCFKKVRQAAPLGGLLPALVLLFGASYGLWALVFGVMRYEVVLEFLSALLFVSLAQYLLGPVTGAVLAVAITFCLVVAPKMNWGRTAYAQTNFQATLPAVEENALVLLGGHLSFLTLANPQAQYVGGIWFRPEDYPEKQKYRAMQLNILRPNDYRFHFEDLIRRKVQQHQGPLYIIGPYPSLTKHPATWARYGVELIDPAQKCVMFTSNLDMYYGGFWLCPARKTARN